MESMDQAAQYSCPHCQGQLEVISEPTDQPEVACPHCGQPIVIGSEPTDAAKLDVARIKTLSRGCRAALRVRSYYVIVEAACGILAIDLLGRAARQFMLGQSTTQAIIDLAVVVALVLLGWRFQIKAKSIVRQEMREIAEAAVPPDFSSLSDGSHVAENLEGMK